MQLAEILSDLTSLRVCGNDEALALVKSYKKLSDAGVSAAGDSDKVDPELQRAKDLVALHYDVKMNHVEKGLDDKLRQAREDVRKLSDN